MSANCNEYRVSFIWFPLILRSLWCLSLTGCIMTATSCSYIMLRSWRTGMVVMALSEINGTYSRINVKNAQAGIHCREWHPIHLHPGLSCHQLFQLIGWYLEATIIVINILFLNTFWQFTSWTIDALVSGRCNYHCKQAIVKYILLIYIMNNQFTGPWRCNYVLNN